MRSFFYELTDEGGVGIIFTAYLSVCFRIFFFKINTKIQ